MTTEQLIKTLRNSMPPGPITQGIMLDAADRLEELQRANQSALAHLALALSERTPHDYGILKEEATFLRKERDKALTEVERVRKLWNESHVSERDDFAKEIERVKAECGNKPLTTRPEPSRLEIAAMAMQGMLAASSFDTLQLSKSAFEAADELIAAAKDVK